MQLRKIFYEHIKKLQVNDYINIDEDFDLPKNVHLDVLKANNVIIGGEIKGERSFLVNGFNLQDLAETHLSKNNSQNITRPVNIPRAVLRGGFNTNYFNNYDFKEAVQILKNLKTNEQMLNESSIDVDQMFVNGSVYFTHVNGYDFKEINATAIRLDQPNFMDFPITFLDTIYVNGNMSVEMLNGENFNAFVNDLVRKSANSSRVYGTTVFKEDVSVVNNVEVTTINEIQVDRILTKNYNREIINPIRIIGDVSVPKLNVKGKLNGVTAEELKLYHYDSQTGTHVLHKNVFFNESVYIKYLQVHGGYNNVGNVDERLKDLIRTDRPAVITGTKTFTDNVHFESGIHIVDYNGINVPQFLSDVVLIDQLEPVDIYSDIVFNAPVTFPSLNIAGDLITTKINNCSIAEWIQTTIRTDQPFNFNGTIVFPDETFQATNIYTKYLNENLMDDVLTLNTPQNFSGDANFNDVYSSVPIAGYGRVSGYDLQHERNNTLMVSLSFTLLSRNLVITK